MQDERILLGTRKGAHGAGSWASGFGAVLHRGAKVRAMGPSALPVDDPAQLLQWLAPDRALLMFNDAADLAAREAAFVDLIAQWVNPG